MGNIKIALMCNNGHVTTKFKLEEANDIDLSQTSMVLRKIEKDLDNTYFKLLNKMEE